MGPEVMDRPSGVDAGDLSHRIIDILNDGALALLLSIGHRTKLFDVMVGRPPSTAEEIAEAASLNERYVREWLEGVVKGGIVSHDPAAGTFEVPPGYGPHLSRSALSKNLAELAELVPILGAQEDRIVESFRRDGHTPFDARPSFRELISKAAHESDQAVVETLVDSIFPLVPGLLDGLRAGIEVLDIGCGNGRAVMLTALAFPNSTFHGYDSFQHHIDRAKYRAFMMGLNNVYFRQKSIAELDDPARYHLITDFGGIRDETRPKQVLENIARALRPRGIFLMQELAASSHVTDRFGLPQDSLLHTLESLAETDEDRTALGGEQKATRSLLEASFESLVVHRLPHHIYNCYFVATKGGEGSSLQ